VTLRSSSNAGTHGGRRGREGAMRVMATGRLAPEARIVIGDERRNETVGCLGIGDVSEPQFLDQLILQGLMCAFHPPLRLRRVRANDVDVELLRRPGKLRLLGASM